MMMEQQFTLTAEKGAIQEIEKADYSLFIVNKYDFTDPTTGVHKQQVEKTQGSAKQHYKKTDQRHRFLL